jgi:ankyrin repeat protein
VLDGRIDPVVDAFGPGFAGVVGGSPHGTLLHHAAWVGSAETVRALLERGARPGAMTDTGTPLDWAVHGSGNGLGDHVAVAELLVAAGEDVTEARADAADGPLHDWLAARA